jgi:cytochrome c
VKASALLQDQPHLNIHALPKVLSSKYAGDSAALARLEQKVKNGGSGVWGAIPMPPNNVPDADLKALVEWILALK